MSRHDQRNPINSTLIDISFCLPKVGAVGSKGPDQGMNLFDVS